MWDFAKHSDKVAFINENNEELSYLKLSKACNKFAQQLPKRSLVFCLCENSFGSMVGYVSFIQNKIVPLMLDSKIDLGLLNNLDRSYQPHYYWLPSTMVNNFKDCLPVFSLYEYTLLKSKWLNTINLFDELALLMTTSGSTGSPKLVRQSYINIKSNAESISKYLNITPNDRSITSLPMSYSYGLSIVNSYLQSGSSISITSKSIIQKEFWQQIKRHKVTSFSGVPYSYEILNKINFFNQDLQHLKTLTQAGGKLPEKLNQKFASYAREKQKRFYVMYGQTEATARMSYLPLNYSISKCGSIGIAIPGGNFYLVDEQKKKITTPNQSGELVYKGKNVTLGYAQDLSDLAKKDKNLGILYTGDIAEIDQDGFYWIKGRKKRFIKIFGNRINLDEIEQILRKQFDSIDIACTGNDNCVFIYITNSSFKDKVHQFITKITRLHPSAFKIKFIDMIPKSVAGKTNYKKLEKAFF